MLSLIKKIPFQDSKLPQKRSYYCKLLLQKKTLQRCGISCDEGKEYRLCQNHKKEKITITHNIEHKNKNVDLKYKITVPVGIGISNETSAPSKKKQAMREEIQKNIQYVR